MHARSLSFAFLVVVLSVFPATARSQAGPDNGGLLQPGEPYPGTQQAPIQLHLPPHHAVGEEQKTSASKAAPNASEGVSEPAQSASSAPELSQPTVRLRHPKHSAPASLANVAPASSARETIPFSFDADDQPPAPAATQPSAAKPTTIARIPASAPTSPVAIQSATPHGSASISDTGDHANLTKRGAIMFDKSAPAPSPVQYRALKVLAGNLNSALETGASRIQLEAYGGAPGDKSSDARRLSLRRALAVRQLLIDDGVPSARIDVRAMGGADDKGPPDRVDVFIRAS